LNVFPRQYLFVTAMASAWPIMQIIAMHCDEVKMNIGEITK